MFLVDFENVDATAFTGVGVLAQTDEVFVLYTKACIRTPKTLESFYLKTKATLTMVFVENGHKNALDFQLASLLGRLSREEQFRTKYFIISKDKGYDCLSVFMQRYGTTVKRRESILTALLDASSDDEELNGTEVEAAIAADVLSASVEEAPSPLVVESAFQDLHKFQNDEEEEDEEPVKSKKQEDQKESKKDKKAKKKAKEKDGKGKKKDKLEEPTVEPVEPLMEAGKNKKEVGEKKSKKRKKEPLVIMLTNPIPTPIPWGDSYTGASALGPDGRFGMGTAAPVPINPAQPVAKATAKSQEETQNQTSQMEEIDQQVLQSIYQALGNSERLTTLAVGAYRYAKANPTAGPNVKQIAHKYLSQALRSGEEVKTVYNALKPFLK